MNSLRIARLALRPSATTTTLSSRSFSIIGDAIGKFTSNRVDNTKGKVLCCIFPHNMLEFVCMPFSAPL